MKSEIEKLKLMNFAEKRDYIWAYYKLHIIGLIIILVLGGSFINDVFLNPQPRSALSIAWMAGFEPEENFTVLTEALTPVVTHDHGESVQLIDFSMGGHPQQEMAQHVRFSAMVSANELDIVIGTLESGEEFTGLGIVPAWAFMDLRHLFPEADGVLIYDGEEATNLAFAVPIEGSAFLEEIGIDGENRFLGVLSNTQRDEAVRGAIEFLWAAP